MSSAQQLNLKVEVIISYVTSLEESPEKPACGDISLVRHRNVSKVPLAIRRRLPCIFHYCTLSQTHCCAGAMGQLL